MDIKSLIREVLEKGYLMSLGVADSGGVWVSDVIYTFDDDFNIYWVSDPDCRHSQAIDKNRQVAGTITASDKKKEELGLQFSGLSEKLDAVPELVKSKYLAKNPISSKDGEDFLMGDSWFVLRPKLMELINNKLFRFEKKKLEL